MTFIDGMDGMDGGDADDSCIASRCARVSELFCFTMTTVRTLEVRRLRGERSLSHADGVEEKFSMRDLADWLVDKADWARGLRVWEEAGNISPTSESFKGIHGKSGEEGRAGQGRAGQGRGEMWLFRRWGYAGARGGSLQRSVEENKW